VVCHFVEDLRAALRLRSQSFNVCFVNERQIRNLNAAYRGEPRATDVLSFPWTDAAGIPGSRVARRRLRSGSLASNRGSITREFAGFLGDIVISVPNARRNARAEGHTTANEIRWLIVHGTLHLLGYDHENDRGEMTALELALRERLGIHGRRGTGKRG